MRKENSEASHRQLPNFARNRRSRRLLASFVYDKSASIGLYPTGSLRACDAHRELAVGEDRSWLCTTCDWNGVVDIWRCFIHLDSYLIPCMGIKTAISRFTSLSRPHVSKSWRDRREWR